MQEQRRASGIRRLFVVRKERWSLTWTSRLIVLVLLTGAAVAFVRNLYPFLAVSDPANRGVLVVEAWMPTFGYRDAAERFREGHYSTVLAVSSLHEDVDDELEGFEGSGAGLLLRFGVPDSAIVTVSSRRVERDRTLHSAQSVREWLLSHVPRGTPVDVITVGAHARRSRLLFESVLGEDYPVGIISVRDRRFDPDRWWAFSEGARSMIGETIGYAYARVRCLP
ncbi:MAG: hypothetical protein U1F54_15970 [Burkholderiales bacterium]